MACVSLFDFGCCGVTEWRTLSSWAFIRQKRSSAWPRRREETAISNVLLIPFTIWPLLATILAYPTNYLIRQRRANHSPFRHQNHEQIHLLKKYSFFLSSLLQCGDGANAAFLYWQAYQIGFIVIFGTFFNCPSVLDCYASLYVNKCVDDEMSNGWVRLVSDGVTVISWSIKRVKIVNLWPFQFIFIRRINMSWINCAIFLIVAFFAFHFPFDSNLWEIEMESVALFLKCATKSGHHSRWDHH